MVGGAGLLMRSLCLDVCVKETTREGGSTCGTVANYSDGFEAFTNLFAERGNQI